MQTAETWSMEAQQELAQIAHEIDAALKGERYHVTKEELRAIDEAQAAVNRGETASEDKARALLAIYRRMMLAFSRLAITELDQSNTGFRCP